MSDEIFRFDDGTIYDTMMGPWSRSVGELFIDWIQPAPELRWLDVGCGSGVFSRLVAERCDPQSILGIDPSEDQLIFARRLQLGDHVRFAQGDAMALPLEDGAVDAAVAALVLFFMPDPQRGVTEMARVVTRGGIVAAYAWDLEGGGFPYVALDEPMRELGFSPGQPPHPEVAAIPVMEQLWSNAGVSVEATRAFTVTRRFASFEDYWSIATTTPRMVHALKGAPADKVAELKQRVRLTVPDDPDGRVVPAARANAIWGRKR